MENFQNHTNRQISEYCVKYRRRYLASIMSEVDRYIFHGPLFWCYLIGLVFSSLSFYYRTNSTAFLYIHFFSVSLLISYRVLVNYFPNIKKFSLSFHETLQFAIAIEAYLMISHANSLNPALVKDNYIYSLTLILMGLSITPLLYLKLIRDFVIVSIVLYGFYPILKYDSYHVLILIFLFAQGVSWFITLILKYNFYINSLISASNSHAYREMSKILYKHQTRAIESGAVLESTMPTHQGTACAISFDIVGSSRIKHIHAADFFRNVFARCNEVISEGYDGKDMQANGYRIKEMGDGFLCSVGYPFASPSSNVADLAVDLARRFATILDEESKNFHFNPPIRCGIGISHGSLCGFYPVSGAKEYDIYGTALVLATRYEAMRKTLFPDVAEGHILIIQEVVFVSLSPDKNVGYKEFDLQKNNIAVRDDPAATRLYYQILSHSNASGTIELGKLRLAS